MPNMQPPYMYRDKGPMGTNMAYRLLPQQFSGDISLASKKMSGVVNGFSYVKGTVYITVGKNIDLENDELDQLLAYVERGNEFFISSGSIDYRLLDTLGIKRGYDNTDTAEDDNKKNTYVQIADTLTYGSRQYGFYYFPFRNIFTGYDSAATRVLGVNEKGKPNYIVTRYGKGKFYFHLAPDAFTNYFLLTAQNTNYYSQVLSYVNKDAHAVFWGDVYKFGKAQKDFSALSIFWNNRMLLYALLLFCLLALLYIAFGSKRKRRLVPLQPVNSNESLSFVHTIGNLYLQKKDNRKIAVKMMTYFLEYIRTNYYLATNHINAEFIQALSRKSGVEESRVQELMQLADQVNNAESITDQELFRINNLIYEFYKK